MNFDDITVDQLKLRIDHGESLQIIDVREPHELEFSIMDQATHIPLGELEDRLGELDPTLDTMVLCRSGMRSAKGADILVENGFKSVFNIVGGINQWAMEIDTDLAVY